MRIAISKRQRRSLSPGVGCIVGIVLAGTFLVLLLNRYMLILLALAGFCFLFDICIRIACLRELRPFTRQALSSLKAFERRALIGFLVGLVLLNLPILNILSLNRAQYLTRAKSVAAYFEEISDGLVVREPDFNRHVRDLGNPEILSWQVADIADDRTVDYTWALYAANCETMEFFRERGVPTDDWWNPTGLPHSSSILLPMNEAALGVHIDLGLPLPAGFSLGQLTDSESR